MKATYGFHAKMTARPGKGDELVNILLSVTDVLGANENCVVFLVGRSAFGTAGQGIEAPRARSIILYNNPISPLNLMSLRGLPCQSTGAPFRCKACGKTFKTQGDLTEHYQQMHPGVEATRQQQ